MKVDKTPHFFKVLTQCLASTTSTVGRPPLRGKLPQEINGITFECGSSASRRSTKEIAHSGVSPLVIKTNIRRRLLRIYLRVALPFIAPTNSTSFLLRKSTLLQKVCVPQDLTFATTKGKRRGFLRKKHYPCKNISKILTNFLQKHLTIFLLHGTIASQAAMAEMVDA